MKMFLIIYLLIFSLFFFNLQAAKIVIPDLSDDAVAQRVFENVPIRLGGPRIERESFEHKLIIHNYGHGFSGTSVAWGSALEVVRLLYQEINAGKRLGPEDIAVVGGGVVGLTVAYLFAKMGHVVRVYAENFPPHTISDKSDGIFYPLTIIEPDRDMRINECSISILTELAKTREIEGVSLVKAFHINSTSSQEVQKCCILECDNGKIILGEQQETILIDVPIYMNDLFAKTIALGVSFHYKRLVGRDEMFFLKEDLIVNCIGLGAMNLFSDYFNRYLLCADTNMRAFRKESVHLVRRDPLLPIFNQSFFSIIPRRDRLILSGDDSLCKILPQVRNFFEVLVD